MNSYTAIRKKSSPSTTNKGGNIIWLDSTSSLIKYQVFFVINFSDLVFWLPIYVSKLQHIFLSVQT